MSDVEALFEAIRSGDDRGLQQLLEGDASLAAARNRTGVSALMTALYHRKRDLADILLAEVPELDIFEAVSLGEREIVGELLRDDEALVSAEAVDGFFPLHLACFFDHAPMAERLILRGADVHARARNASEVEPLHSAAAGRSLECVRVLLEAGADPNATQKGGWTPLHSAAGNGDAEIARLLVEKGADLHAANDEGLKPIDVAKEAGFESVL